jgi:hypothetical protein
VFVSALGALAGWQNEQMWAAIQTRVEDAPGYRVIPALVPGAAPPNMRNLPCLLRLHEPIEFKRGLSEEYCAALAHGKGRVVMASSRPDELSWALGGMKNSLFTHYLLEALRGEGRTLGDGYVRVFDIFRHVSETVPTKARQVAISQHPVSKTTAMEEDFAVARTRRYT